jgi:hypothetical protein
MEWWKETIFLEIDQLIEVFRRTDEKVKLRRIRSLAGPLTWRAVARYVTGIRSMKIYDDCATTVVEGVKPWQQDVIVASMAPEGYLARFLRELPEPDLEVLHRRFRGLLSAETQEVLEPLAEAICGAGLLGRGMKDIAATVGMGSTRNLERLTEAVEAYHLAHVGDKAITRYREAGQVPAEVFTRLIKGPAPGTAERRAELFALWLRTDPRPMAPHMSNLCELPVLQWLLKGNAEAVFRLMVETHAEELASFTTWFLELALPHVERLTDKRPLHGFVENTFGVMYHGGWASLAKEVEEAAQANGIPVPDGIGLPTRTGKSGPAT